MSDEHRRGRAKASHAADRLLGGGQRRQRRSAHRVLPARCVPGRCDQRMQRRPRVLVAAWTLTSALHAQPGYGNWACSACSRGYYMLDRVCKSCEQGLGLSRLAKAVVVLGLRFLMLLFVYRHVRGQRLVRSAVGQLTPSWARRFSSSQRWARRPSCWRSLKVGRSLAHIHSSAEDDGRGCRPRGAGDGAAGLEHRHSRHLGGSARGALRPLPSGLVRRAQPSLSRTSPAPNGSVRCGLVDRARRARRT